MFTHLALTRLRKRDTAPANNVKSQQKNNFSNKTLLNNVLYKKNHKNNTYHERKSIDNSPTFMQMTCLFFNELSSLPHTFSIYYYILVICYSQRLTA
ncbi:hypothetical protein BZJ21_00135 [Salinivibrio costicola subsp. alcaliphilus]|uniref:Uncharacterized protein n=1 Tax=Salinivibrio costicola subsp. alcaliphilus TaxID=272773 RepID=A0ABX3KUU8_SALCS|nr:hypothetical protein BZJ21_00135 [Salinivibrio costicola subsp. alcaliphilus]